MIGKTLSHYRIDDEIGRGGMGVVYRATDTKLNRTVALKILPASALANEDDRARFFREAQAAAQLSHPNVCHVYQVDEAMLSDEGSEAPASGESRPFIAMEFIDGQSLRNAIGESPMKLREAVRLASQVAEALKAAHSKDIVHRDIKSQNIMLTKEGDAKVLDFGLAKTAQSTLLTQMGATLGTVAYMSPEQARGDTVDNRTDLWSLGVMFYEMISGRLPFAGEYEKAVIYGILNEMPEPLTAVRTGVPMGLEWIVSKLLAKNPEERYQSATDLLVDLKTVDLSSSGMSRTSTATTLSGVQSQIAMPTADGVSGKKGRSPAWVWPAFAVVLLLGATLSWLLKPAPGTFDRPIIRFSQPLAPGQAISSVGRKALAISPSGKTMAFTANSKLFVRHLNDLQTDIELPGVSGARDLTFSPDGSQIAYGVFSERALYRVPVSGGAPIKITDLTGEIIGKTWGKDGYIYFGLGIDGIWRVPDTGGTPELLVENDSTESNIFHGPQMLPSGKHVLYTAGTVSWDDTELFVIDITTGEKTLIHGPGSDGRYLSTGHIVYRLNGALFAFGFDTGSLSKTTGPAPVISSVSVSPNTGTAQWDVSDEGTFVMLPGSGTGGEHLGLYDLAGVAGSVSEDEKDFFWPRFSPDGTRIAVGVSQGDGTSDIWIYDVSRGIGTRYATSSDGVRFPIWSSDGERIAYVANGNPNSIVSRRLDRPNIVDTLYSAQEVLELSSWSPDGKTIAFNYGPATRSSIGLLDVETGQAIQFVNFETDDDYAQFSPSGNWLAYESQETNNNEVYVTNMPEGTMKLRVSETGGQKPQWSADESTIYFLSASLDAAYSAPFDAVSGTVGLPVRMDNWPELSTWEWTFDRVNNRFALVEPVRLAGASREQFQFVVNWFQDLNNLVPLNK